MLWKWNYETHEYDLFPIRPEWRCVTIGELDDIVNCPHCGKEILVANAYTSYEIQEQKCGFGYLICRDCADEEWKRRKKNYYYD